MRSNRKITAFGQTLILSEWARLKGIELSTLWVRLVRLKWDPERALSTPVYRKKNVGELVRKAGYVSVSDFFRKTGCGALYDFAKGKGLRPDTAKRLTELLGVEIPPEQVKPFHFSVKQKE